MNFRDIVFLTIAEFGSFTRASKELNISQPAVTKHVKELEGNLNCKLFNRGNSKVSLTIEGRVVYNHLKKIKRDYRELYDDLETFNLEFGGEINIGASTTIANYILPKIIAEFSNRYPKIKINLITGNSYVIINKLMGDDIDIAFIENSSSTNGLKYITFMSDEIIGVCGVNTLYSKKSYISKDELEHIPIILREKGSGTLEVINKHLLHIDLNVKHSIGTTEGIKGVLLDFNGIALMSNKAVENEIRSNHLKKIEIKDFKIIRELRIAHRQGHISEQVKKFIRFALS